MGTVKRADRDKLFQRKRVPEAVAFPARTYAERPLPNWTGLNVTLFCFHQVILLLLFLSACFLAYSNGANDNFKGVASLYGSGVCGYRTALGWATVATLAGSLSSIFLARRS